MHYEEQLNRTRYVNERQIMKVPCPNLLQGVKFWKPHLRKNTEYVTYGYVTVTEAIILLRYYLQRSLVICVLDAASSELVFFCGELRPTKLSV